MFLYIYPQIYLCMYLCMYVCMYEENKWKLIFLRIFATVVWFYPKFKILICIEPIRVLLEIPGLNVINIFFEKILLPQPDQIQQWQSGQRVMQWQEDAQTYSVPVYKLSQIVQHSSPKASQQLSPLLLIHHQEEIIGIEGVKYQTW